MCECMSAARLIRRVSVFVCVCILAGRMFVCAYVCANGVVCVCTLVKRMDLYVSMYVCIVCVCLYVGKKDVCMYLCMCVLYVCSGTNHTHRMHTCITYVCM